MSLLKNYLTKKKGEQPHQEQMFEGTGILDEAEHVANVVKAGIEQENYQDMNLSLDKIRSKEKPKEMVIFPCSKGWDAIVSIIIGVVMIPAFLGLALIAFETLVLSGDEQHIAFASLMAIGSLAIILINAVIIWRGICSLRFKKRYNHYFDLLWFKGLEYIENLSTFSGMPKEKVRKDLLRAIKLKLIPQGHFSRESTVFIASDWLYNQYMQKPAVYDRYFRKQLEERHRIESRTDEISQIIEQGEQYIQKIRDSNNLIKDKAVSQELVEMESVVVSIYHEIDMHPSYAHTLGLFLYSYLPTTEKLLEAYIDIIEKGTDRKSINTSKKEIEAALHKINISFENILERIYEEQERDIVSTIEAMEIMFEQEGLVEN